MVNTAVFDQNIPQDPSPQQNIPPVDSSEVFHERIESNFERFDPVGLHRDQQTPASA